MWDSSDFASGSSSTSPSSDDDDDYSGVPQRLRITKPKVPPASPGTARKSNTGNVTLKARRDLRFPTAAVAKHEPPKAVAPSRAAWRGAFISARKELQLSQAEFGLLLSGLQPFPGRTVRRWEQGKRPIPGWVMVQALAWRQRGLSLEKRITLQRHASQESQHYQQLDASLRAAGNRVVLRQPAASPAATAESTSLVELADKLGISIDQNIDMKANTRNRLRLAARVCSRLQAYLRGEVSLPGKAPTNSARILGPERDADDARSGEGSTSDRKSCSSSESDSRARERSSASARGSEPRSASSGSSSDSCVYLGTVQN